MLRPSPNHGTQRLPNDDDLFCLVDKQLYTLCTTCVPTLHVEVTQILLCVASQIVSVSNVHKLYVLNNKDRFLIYYQVKQCPQCHYSEKVKTIAPELQSIQSEAPWDVVGVDFIGPFTKPPDDNTYICTMTDLFSKFVYATSIRYFQSTQYGLVSKVVESRLVSSEY